MTCNRFTGQPERHFLMPGFMWIGSNRHLLLAAMLAFSSNGWTEEFHIAAGDIAGLSAAVNASNANDEPDTIYLAAGTYTISENNPENFESYFTISSPVSIRGVGSAQTVIERKDAFPFHFFFIDSQGELTLSDVTLTGGNGGSACGGAIQVVDGKLTIDHCTFSNNYTRFGFFFHVFTPFFASDAVAGRE